MNRGGLIVPTELAQFVVRTAACIVLEIDSQEPSKQKFHSVVNQKSLLTSLARSAVEVSVEGSDQVCLECDQKLLSLLEEFLKPISTILVSCYARRLNSFHHKEIQRRAMVAKEKRAENLGRCTNTSQAEGILGTQEIANEPMDVDVTPTSSERENRYQRRINRKMNIISQR